MCLIISEEVLKVIVYSIQPIADIFSIQLWKFWLSLSFEKYVFIAKHNAPESIGLIKRKNYTTETKYKGQSNISFPWLVLLSINAVNIF